MWSLRRSTRSCGGAGCASSSSTACATWG
jgi:hypothetical protein